MGKVNFLPEKIINKIAAGEVVESPASVLKELLENSIDANSKKIDVEILDSGKKLIYVKDDGEGIEPDDIEKIFERYATSKIKELEDLYNIKTLGFRGEALFSIGAVSDVILRSKKIDLDFGKEIHIRGGKKLSIKNCSMSNGTVVEVRELFFNTPARKKFLKSDITEYRKIINTFIPYTIIFYWIEFSFKNEKAKVINLLPSESLIKRFCEVLNIEEKYLLYKNEIFKEFEVEIIIGDLNLKRPHKDIQFIFVNNRPVYNQFLSSVINNFYQTFFSTEFFPVFALSLKLPSENIDVNIHPTKREVKIKDEKVIEEKIEKVLNDLLSKSGVKQVILKNIYNKTPEKIIEEAKIKDSIELKNEELFSQLSKRESLIEKIKNSIFIGTFKNKYLIFEFENSLLFVDQHAAYERINYEKFLKEIETGNIQVQQLLTPLIINLNPEEMSIWEKTEKIIEKYGFITTKWSENKIAIHGYPSLIKNIEFSIRNILAEKDIKKYDKESLAKRACKSSVVAGQKLNEQEIKYLIEKLEECENPFVCPHGRPIVIEISEKFLDNQFLR